MHTHMDSATCLKVLTSPLGRELPVQMVKRNQVWQQAGDIQNNCSVSLTKLIAALPAPAGLESTIHHTNMMNS